MFKYIMCIYYIRRKAKERKHMITAIYYKAEREAALTYIGRVAYDQTMTIGECVDTLGISKERIEEETGDKVKFFFHCECDASDVEDLQRGDKTETAFFCFKTPNGDRFIEIPVIPGRDMPWDAVGVISDKVYDGVDPDNWWIESERPRMEEFEDGDETKGVIVSITGTESNNVVYEEFDTSDEAIDAAEAYWDHLTDSEKEDDDHISMAAIVTKTWSDYSPDINEIFWDAKEDY